MCLLYAKYKWVAEIIKSFMVSFVRCHLKICWKKKSWGELRGRCEKNLVVGQTFPPFPRETAGIKQTTEESSWNANLHFSVKSLKKLCHYGSTMGVCSNQSVACKVNSEALVTVCTDLGWGGEQRDRAGSRHPSCAMWAMQGAALSVTSTAQKLRWLQCQSHNFSDA